MVAAVGKLPADTRTVIAVGVAEMRADSDFAAMIAAAVKRPELTLLFGKSEACPIGIADIDWVVLGFPEAGVHREGDMLIRGRWTDAQLETCLAALAGSAKPAVDPGTGMVHVDGTGTDYWFGTDGNVTAISSRDKASAAHVKAILARTEGPGGPTGAIVAAQLDRNAMLWFVLDADPGDDYGDFDIPAGGDVGVWARIDNGLRGVILGRMKNEADAKKAEATMRVEIDKLVKEGSDLMGKFEVARNGADVTLTAWLTPLTMAVAAQQVLAGLE